MNSHTRLRIIIGVVSALALLALVGAVIAANGLSQTERQTRTLQGPVNRIEVDSDAGDLRLRTATGAGVTVRETRKFSSNEPDVSVALRDGVLRIEVRCDGVFTFRCSDDLDVTVPDTIRTAALQLDSGDADVVGLEGERFAIESDSGDVHAQDIRGALALGADSGDVNAEATTGPLTLDSDSGDVGATRVVTAGVTATTDSGDVVLDLETSPEKVKAETDSGDVEIELPGGRYRIDTDTDSGDTSIDGLLSDDAASRRVTASTDSGDVTMRGR
jgi:DUF4097 and DUF4098 domain-containing protein YvlB